MSCNVYICGLDCVQAVYHGFGLTVTPERLTAPTLTAALRRVLQEPHFKVSITLPQTLTCIWFVTETHLCHRIVHCMAIQGISSSACVEVSLVTLGKMHELMLPAEAVQTVQS